MSGDNSSAGRKPQVKKEDITAVFRNANIPVLSTSDVADKLPISQRGTFDRLQKLEKDGVVGSELFPAGGAKVRVWWHTTVTGVPHAWSQTESASSKIGVEVIDNLTLPGDGEALRKRRHAVSTVFKYLFIKGEVPSSDLREIAWAANAINTFAKKDSLWNNCISKALSQATSLFVFYKENDSWGLTTFGESIKIEIGENSFWEDWAKKKRSLAEALFQAFWKGFNDFMWLHDTDIQLSDPERRDIHVTGFRDFEPSLLFQLELQREIWLGLTGTLYSQLQISDDEETIRALLNSQDEIQTELSKTTTWHHDADQTILRISTSRQVKIDPNRMDLRGQSNSRNKMYLPIQEPQWVIEVAEEFHDVFHDRCQ